MDLANARIVLTGAASGIGRALLDLLARHEAQIVAADVDVDALALAVGELGDHPARIRPYACDLSTQAGVDNLFAFAVGELGAIDLFIANAGFAYYERVGAPEWDHIERIFRTNVVSSLYAAGRMAALNAGRPCRVVITASAMGLLAIPGYALYSATKAALHRFAEAYRFELDDPRTLMLVYPIGTRTGFFAAAGRDVPQPWPTQSAERVARAILRGIGRDARAVYPSPLFSLVIALDRVLPFVRRIEQAIELRRFRRWLAEQRRSE